VGRSGTPPYERAPPPQGGRIASSQAGTFPRTPVQTPHRRTLVRLSRALSLIVTCLALAGPASAAADRIVLVDKFGYAA